MDSMDQTERKIAVQGHGVSTCSAKYELLTTPVSICSVITIVGCKKVVLLHADSSIKGEDIEEIVEELQKDNEDGPKPKVSYVCSSKPGYIEQWTDIMDGQLPEFCYPQRSRIKFSAGKFIVCNLQDPVDAFYHIPKTDVDALVDTECLWASLYFTDSIRFGPILLDTRQDLSEALMTAANALSVVHLLSFDGVIKEIQVDAFLRRFWRTTNLGRFLEEFAPILLSSFKDWSHLSVAEVLNRSVVSVVEKKKVEDIVVDYGILILSFLDTLKNYTYPTSYTNNRGNKDSAKPSVKEKAEESTSSPPRNTTSRRRSQNACMGPSLFEESFGSMKISTDEHVAQTRPRRVSAIKLFEKKR